MPHPTQKTAPALFTTRSTRPNRASYKISTRRHLWLATSLVDRYIFQLFQLGFPNASLLFSYQREKAYDDVIMYDFARQVLEPRFNGMPWQDKHPLATERVDDEMGMRTKKHKRARKWKREWNLESKHRARHVVHIAKMGHVPEQISTSFRDLVLFPASSCSGIMPWVDEEAKTKQTGSVYWSAHWFYIMAFLPSFFSNMFLASRMVVFLLLPFQ
ncbi:uncharacterized protein CLUP02_16464 [Colletotrichum lupini]|uniref:Uncharacterized protein n=1 Tax=Colletotrichum lupini TaxID=145971 RepID=A0A9Q8T9V2_9PEZI|nr:uncharacterized protein CLUP02_16464 [Colletotrichum lupini]UQC90932.1 hypothetical protein CLUP02_16464 [Colletotrichum lupini]